MKKTLLLAASALIFSGAFAQDAKKEESSSGGGGLTSKKGETILPEAGDWALGIDAAPILNYFGRFLSNAGATSPTWGYTNNAPLSITGKYFMDEKTAYRGMLRLGFGSTTTNGYSIQDGQAAPDPTITVKDSRKASYSNVTLGVGLEKRRGKTRLQGYYGGMFMVGFGGSKNKYTYGNAMSATDSIPTRTNFGTNMVAANTWATEEKMGSTFMLGLRGFIGAEYFIFPKIAVGAEFGWGVGMRSTGDGSVTTETWSKKAQKVATTKTGGTKSFGIDTDVNSAQLAPTGILTLTMHF